MKKITLGFSILAASAIFVTGCNKKVTEAPVADMEFASSVDASYANSIVTDIEMVCGFLGENQSPRFVSPAPGVAPITHMFSPDQSASYTWPANTKCMDGKVRSGTIAMTFSFTDNNTDFYRDYKFVAFVTLSNYVVDGWMVDDSTTFVIRNEATAANPNAATTKLKWSMDGNFNITNVADPTKKMTWIGKLNKVLANTSQLVPAPSQATSITWTAAVVEYDGTFKGVTTGNVPYTYTVGTEKPLVRNYTCSPDKVLGVNIIGPPTAQTVQAVNSEFHPFINGVASFTTSSKEPRSIDYGSEGAPCDNSGTITLKGISYPVDFKK